MSTGSNLRGDALACLRAAVLAVEPRRLVRGVLSGDLDCLPIGTPLRLVGFGKAAAAMAWGAHDALGARLQNGLLIVPPELGAELPPGCQVLRGGHPIPTPAGVEAARALREKVRTAAVTEVVLCLISGGGSALMTLPPDGVSLDDLQSVTRALLRAGAPIGPLNAVRKHLDDLKGGRLAREIAPASAVGLVLSDVVGDRLDVIASGPLSPDPTSFADAIAVLRRYDVWGETPAPVRTHLEAGLAGRISESPKPGDPCFGNVRHAIVGNALTAAQGAAAEARRRGYATACLSPVVTGEARRHGVVLGSVAHAVRRRAGRLAPPVCIVTAGETTVTVRGAGFGGRNQEVALGAARRIAGLPNVTVGALGTDGIDGPTDAAGALATGETLERARSLGLDPDAALDDNDSYPFFEALGDLVRTGPTGTNVGDVHVLLVGRA